MSNQQIEKPNLDVYVSAEASDDEKTAVADCFDEFEVEIHKGEYRASEIVLTLVVTVFLGVVSSAVYDLLKKAISKLRHDAKLSRKVEVKVHKSNVQYIITPELFLAIENTEERYFSSLEELFDDLKQDRSQHDKDQTPF
jgi:hypothetical protein